MSTIDFNKPVTTDLYTAWPTEIQAAQTSLAAMLDPSYVTAISNPVAGAKRYNTSTGLIEQWSGTAWAAAVSTYARTDGSVYSGASTFNNNVPVNWKDTGGTARRMVLLTGSNEMYVGDIDNVMTGFLHLASKTAVTAEINSVVMGSWNSSGLNVTGAGSQLFIKGASEAVRIAGDAGYVSIWNTANGTRTGYLQGNTGANLALVAENGASLQFGTASIIRASFDTSGQFVFQTATAYVGHNNTTANIVIGAAPSLVDGIARIELYDSAHATLPKNINYRGDVHAWTKAAASTPYMAINSAGTLVVGSNMASTYDFTGRAVIEAHGATNALIGLSINGSSASYLYNDGSNFHLTNVVSGGSLTLDTSSTTRVTIASNGLTTFAGGAATAPLNMGSTSGAITIDASKSNVFYITLNGNLTTLTISNQADGQTLNVFINQDGTGSRTMSGLTNANGYVWPGGVQGVLSTAAGSHDLLCMTWNASVGRMFCTLAKGFS